MRSHINDRVAGHAHGHGHVEQDMLSVEEAYDRIMASFSPLEPVETPLLDALGRVLAADIKSTLDIPTVANSGMDGYAVRGEDIYDASADNPRRLKVIGLVAAGQVP